MHVERYILRAENLAGISWVWIRPKPKKTRKRVIPRGGGGGGEGRGRGRGEGGGEGNNHHSLFGSTLGETPASYLQVLAGFNTYMATVVS